MHERAITLEGTQGPILGILAEPEGRCNAAVLIVAGQPQTRVGAHRMFVDLARGLAAQGVASLRFDCGGWGDSPGDAGAFEASAPDIARAAAFLARSLNSDAPLWIWGLCDGASAAVLALPAVREAGVSPAALCLVNPWVRSEASLGDAMIRTYYARRILSGEFWGRLLTGKVPLRNLFADPARHLAAKLFGGRSRASVGAGADAGTVAGDDPAQAQRPAQAQAPTAPTPPVAAPSRSEPDLPSQLLAQLAAYRGTVLTVLSGNDLTAGETESLMSRDKRWRKRLDRKGAILRVAGADHTFSQPAHWASVVDWMARKAAAA
ncbi:MAG: alpha/beta hydrolase [Burkholderiaceae bacterium]